MIAKTNAMFCESIHYETNGKFILVGVLSGNLQTNASQLSEEFCAFINFHDLTEGDHNIELRLVGPDKKPTTNSFKVSIPEGNSQACIQINGIPFEAKKSGSFVLSWRFSGAKKWNKITEIMVDLEIDPPAMQ